MYKIPNLLNINIPVILASKSPRRKQLLSLLGINFEIITSDINEDIDSDLPPEAYCLHLAFSKAEAVSKKVRRETLIIGADTIVVLDDIIINKPKDKEDAFRILRQLSGNTHFVYTGIALINSKTKVWLTNYQKTQVTFRDLSDEEILAYIESGSPMDKAGGYGIQDDFGAVFVRDIQGCYYNIVGLPLELLYSSIKQFLLQNI